ncbi:outer membrane protein assembly factor BamB family protein [Streptomyces sp. NPDC001774]
MTFPYTVDRILGARSFAEIGHPGLTVSDAGRGLLAVAGTHDFSDHPTVGVYDSATLSCRALVRCRDHVRAMAFHPTLPLLAVGTGTYDGGYFFSGELLLLDLATGTSVSAFEDAPGRQVLGLEWLDAQRLRVLTAPPDDHQDEAAHTHGHTAVVRRTDWAAVPPGSVTADDLAGPRIPAARPDGRADAYRTVTDLGPDWEPRLAVAAVEELADGRVLAALGGVRLECRLPSGERAWAVPDAEGGREIAVTGDGSAAWVSVVRRDRQPPQTVVRLSLVDGAELDRIETSAPVSLVSTEAGEPTLVPAGYRIGGAPVAVPHPLRIRRSEWPFFLSFTKRRGARRSDPGAPWVATGAPRPGRAGGPAETSTWRVRRLFPLSWVPGEEHVGGPGVAAGDGSLIHAGRVFRQRHEPVDSFVVRREAADGTPRWIFRTDRSATALDADEHTAFVAYDDGEIIALDLADGTVRWQHRLTLGHVSAIPTALTVTGAGRLLIGTRDGRVLVCHPRT